MMLVLHSAARSRLDVSETLVKAKWMQTDRFKIDFRRMRHTRQDKIPFVGDHLLRGRRTS